MRHEQARAVSPVVLVARRDGVARVAADPVALENRRRLTQVAAAAVVVAVGAWYPLLGGFTVGTALVLALLPVALPAVVRFRGGALLLACGALAIAAGFVLTALARADHRVIDSVTRDSALLLLGILVGVAAVLWARTVWGDAWVALFFGAGMMIDGAMASPGANAWKFAIGLPVTVVVLALAWVTRRWFVELLALLVLAALCATNDSRSMFGLLLLAVAVVVWQAWRRRRTRRMSAVGLFALLAALSGGVYQLGKALALEGVLGTAAAERSARQIEESGSLLVGSRPEMGASLALLEHRPWGFGFGVLPDGADVRAAKAGMASLGYDPNNGYVHSYMFGRGIELHSAAGDLWAWSGVVGLALAAVMTVLLVRGLVGGLAAGTASALVVVLCLRGLWDMFFAPVHSTLTIFTLALGLALPLVRGARPGRERRRART